MLEPSREVWIYCERRMEKAGVPATERGAYRKWMRYYLDFCAKYGHRPREEASLEPFIAKLESKGQTEAQQEQARRTIRLMLGRYPEAGPAPSERQVREGKGKAKGGAEERRPRAVETVLEPREEAGTRGSGQRRARRLAKVEEGFEPGRDGAPARQASAGASAGTGRGASWVGAYQALEAAIRMRNYSSRTLQSYRHWVRMFQAFTKSKATDRLDAEDVKAFLSDLAVRRGVAGSTQNQAFNALLFFYRQVLGQEFGRLEGVVRAKRRPYVPVVLSRTEMEALFEAMAPPYLLVAQMLYGCGLRLSECLELRVQCLNLDAELVTVHDGKGQKDRTVPLPKRLLPSLREKLKEVGALHREDVGSGYAGTFLPRQLERKYRNAAREYVWQWLFPAATLTKAARTGELRRYHLHDSHVQRAVKAAAERAAIPKRVTPHTLRHTFASHLLLANYDLQTIQRLLGHSDIKTTMIYLQTVPSQTVKEARSPLDLPG